MCYWAPSCCRSCLLLECTVAVVWCWNVLNLCALVVRLVVLFRQPLCRMAAVTRCRPGLSGHFCPGRTVCFAAPPPYAVGSAGQLLVAMPAERFVSWVDQRGVEERLRALRCDGDWCTHAGHRWWVWVDLAGGGKMWLPYAQIYQVMFEDALRHGEDAVCYRVGRYWYKLCLRGWYQQRQSASWHARPRPVLRIPAEDDQPMPWPDCPVSASSAGQDSVRGGESSRSPDLPAEAAASCTPAADELFCSGCDRSAATSVSVELARPEGAAEWL